MTLHLVRRGADCYPMRIAQRGGDAVLLLGDGVYNPPLEGIQIYSSAACARERKIAPPGVPLEDAEIIELIGRAERVIGW